MMREIVLDTETTGLDARNHRIVEIGCLELVNLMPTGRTYHQYVNPEMPMPAEAHAVHGLGDEFLADKPVFAEIAEAFLDFIGDARLVIHNASFDMGFLNAELRRLGFPPLPMERALDTLALARERYPGAQASLDALCRRFEIDNTPRTPHGALLDSELLAEVYLELSGGRQPDFVLDDEAGSGDRLAKRERQYREPRPHAASAAELAAHAHLLEKLQDPLWTRED
jgi:DNA polymerase-3 subunit epsilon